jgi:uncharacterized membrane protein YgcG
MRRPKIDAPRKILLAPRNFSRAPPMTNQKPIHRRWPMLRSLSLVVVPLFSLACADAHLGHGRPDAAVADAAAPVADNVPTATALGDALGAAGLDPAHLPPLAALDDVQRDAVMQTFTQSLGWQCSDCHEADMSVPTRRTRIAAKMWDVFVRGLQLSDGSVVYCDSCHQGAATFLDRRDTSPTGTLADWMRRAYVMPLQRSDGKAHGCATCHGTPYVGKFLDQWGASPPDLGGGGDGGDDSGGDGEGSGGAGGGGGASGSGGGDDSGPDMARLGCGKLLACIDACGSNTRCAGTCKSHAPAAAKKLLQAAQQCAQADCMKAMRCRSASDDSDDCNRCFSNASAGGETGVVCVPADDPNCGDCANEWLACEDN